MRKRIIEVSMLAGFMIFMLESNISKPEIQTYNPQFCEKTAEIPIKTLEIEDLCEQQEDIRNEIMYGELEELAILVQAEAGNQDDLGKRYVADVVLNRVDNSEFPETIHEVIYQANPTQFSPTANGAIEKASYEITEDVFQIVLEEFENRTDSDIIYFRTERYSDCGIPAFKYGNHYFSRG